MDPIDLSQCAFREDAFTIAPRGDFAVATLSSARAFDCPLCEGDGYIYTRAEDGYGQVTDCPKRQNLSRRVGAFNTAKLPARYHDKGFADFRTYRDDNMRERLGNLPDVKARVYQLSGEFVPGDKGLVLYGPVGTGKTHLMCALLRELTLGKGIACRFIEFTHLLSALREAYEKKGQAAVLLERLSSVPALAIDELGKGKKTDWQLGVIDELISKRYNRCLSTFFTTNYPVARESAPAAPRSRSVDTQAKGFGSKLVAETLVDRVDERIVSRLKEMTDLIEISGTEDYRAKRETGRGW